MWSVVKKTDCHGLSYIIEFDQIYFPNNTLTLECELYVSLTVLRPEHDINVQTGKIFFYPFLTLMS